MLPFLDDYLQAKYLSRWLIPFSYIYDQRILQSDWMGGTTGHTKPKMVVSDAIATFLWWLLPRKKSKVLIPSYNIADQRIPQFDWMRATADHTQRKVVVSDDYPQAKNLRDQLIFSRDIDDQRILQSDWLRAFLAIEGSDFFQTWNFCKIINCYVWFLD